MQSSIASSQHSLEAQTTHCPAACTASNLTVLEVQQPYAQAAVLEVGVPLFELLCGKLPLLPEFGRAHEASTDEPQAACQGHL